MCPSPDPLHDPLTKPTADAEAGYESVVSPTRDTTGDCRMKNSFPNHWASSICPMSSTLYLKSTD